MFTICLRLFRTTSARFLRVLTRVETLVAMAVVGLCSIAEARIEYTVPICGGETHVGVIGQTLWSVTLPPGGGDCAWHRLYEGPLREIVQVTGSPCNDRMVLDYTVWDRCGAGFERPVFSGWYIYLFGAGGDDYLENECQIEAVLDGGSGDDEVINLAPFDIRFADARPIAFGAAGNDFLVIGHRGSAVGHEGDDDICLYDGHANIVIGEGGYDTFCGTADHLEVEQKFCSDRCFHARGVSAGG